MLRLRGRDYQDYPVGLFAGQTPEDVLEMRHSFPFDVFVSHNSKDKPRVRQLAERLKQAGLRVWFDEWNILSGDIIALKVDEGLEQSRVLLLCISRDALASGWVALERSTAIHRDPANEDRRFVPLLLTDCDLPDTLRRYKYVDFRKDDDAAFAEVLSACRPSVAKAPPVSQPSAKKTKKPARKQQPDKPSPSEADSLAVFERTLKGHRERVASVAISPDEKWAVSGSWQGESAIKIWDLETGLCRTTLRGHTHDVNSVVITPDGRKVLSASDDNTIRIWDPHAERQLFRLENHTARVLGLALTPDGRVLLSASGDKTVGVWNLGSREQLRSLSGHTGEVWCVSVSRDGSRAVSGSSDRTLKLWNTETGECLRTLEGHLDIVHSVKITPDAKFAVSGSSDKTLRVWDLEAGKCLGTLEGHQRHVLSIALSPDGTLVASTGWLDETVRLWNWRSGACLQVLRHGELWSPTTVTFSPSGSRLMVGSHGGTIEIFRLTRAHAAPSPEATRRYVNAKVVLVGEGTVGKTSLAHRLIEDKYVVRDRTHGMNVWRLELPLKPDARLEREALLWDLAGQEDYRLIHQLFLGETALALLLINPQKGDPFSEAADWLKALKTALKQPESVRDPARLLVFSQVDVGGIKVGNAKIDRFREQHGFAGWLTTSAKTGENCSDSENGGQPSALKQLIAESIPWDKLPWTSTPRLLDELKRAVVVMRDERDIRLLRFAELTQRLEQALPDEKFGESDVRTAVTLLANHGLAQQLKFGDLVLLQPELLNGYGAAIIRAARAHTDEIGCVLEVDVYGKDFDFVGVERRLDRPDEELLLRALVQTFLDHSLCIAEETPFGRHLVFPSQYRREKDIPRDPHIFVSYTFSGEWQTVWTTLVVRLWYSREFKHRELWRNAAEFASPKGFTLGLKIDNKQGEGTAKISLYFDKEVPDDLKAIFIEYVHSHLAKFGCEVVRDRRYVCQECGSPVKDLDAVRRRLDAKKDFITCQECDERVLLIDFIEQRLKSDPIARKILAMDATATRELDNQALEQILIGHMMAIAGEANQIFRPVTMFDHGIDGEVEFKDDDGRASGKRIYIQLKSGNSYLRTRKSDGREVFDVKDERHLEYWVNQPVDVYLVIRQTDVASAEHVIRWMNVTRYIKAQKGNRSRQIVFDGERLDMEAMWKVRDRLLPDRAQVRKT
jgi:DNA-directed RNA polymerase subunit RPC12/RpoP